jgi:hypothetical protein
MPRALPPVPTPPWTIPVPQQPTGAQVEHRIGGRHRAGDLGRGERVGRTDQPGSDRSSVDRQQSDRRPRRPRPGCPPASRWEPSSCGRTRLRASTCPSVANPVTIYMATEPRNGRSNPTISAPGDGIGGRIPQCERPPQLLQGLGVEVTRLPVLDALPSKRSIPSAAVNPIPKTLLDR